MAAWTARSLCLIWFNKSKVTLQQPETELEASELRLCFGGMCSPGQAQMGKNVSAQPGTLATGHTLTDGHGTHGLPFGPYLTLPTSVPCLIIILSSPYQIPQSLIPS